MLDRKDGLYEKYRVFKEPEEAYSHGHPVPVLGPHFVPDETGDPIELEEVEGFVFVLKPDTDPAARVAIMAYAAACWDSTPRLSADLFEMAAEWMTR